MLVSVLADARDLSLSPFEVVERKGRGHPDTLADRLAEALSREYSLMCQAEFGTVLRHQFDKLSLMGGKCDVTYGSGNFVSPIRLLINGRVTPEVGGRRIDYVDRIVTTAKNFLEQELRNFDFYANCRLMLEVSSHTTRGLKATGAYSRFRPQRIEDLPEFKRPLSNDTALGCAWAPFTPLERLVLALEDRLTCDSTRAELPWIGSDVKLMAVRSGTDVHLTICVPQIATEVSSGASYVANAEYISATIADVALQFQSSFRVSVALTPVEPGRGDLPYLLLTGSCIESGDEGQVSRGNRLGGVISSRRPFSIEGLSGKNPQYHGGKLYAAAAWKIAQDIWSDLKVPCEVYIVSQTDRPLTDPWQVVVNTTRVVPEMAVRPIVERHLADVGLLTSLLIQGEIPLV